MEMFIAPFPPPYGKSPAMQVLPEMNRLNRMYAYMDSEEYMHLVRCRDYWLARKTQGIMAIFCFIHNWQCERKASIYQEQINKDMREL